MNYIHQIFELLESLEQIISTLRGNPGIILVLLLQICCNYRLDAELQHYISFSLNSFAVYSHVLIHVWETRSYTKYFIQLSIHVDFRW